jgi:hypothetical protein
LAPSASVSPAEPGTRRIQAVVALRLLEVMRDMDLPVEVLEEEDTTRTIPRRFGLSDVVDRQIRQFREDVRKRVRLTDEDVTGLFRFVIRRPDGAQVFHRVGRLLAGQSRPKRWVRILPDAVGFARARGRTKRLLKRLFGRPVGGFGRGPFVIEGRSLFFIESDPGGDACHLLSGLGEEVLEQTFGGDAEVRHTLCQGRGDDLCRWEGFIREGVASVAPSVGRHGERAGHGPDGSGDERSVDPEDAEILDHRSSG